jgi:hypothetical protein
MGAMVNRGVTTAGASVVCVAVSVLNVVLVVRALSG